MRRGPVRGWAREPVAARAAELLARFRGGTAGRAGSLRPACRGGRQRGAAFGAEAVVRAVGVTAGRALHRLFPTPERAGRTTRPPERRTRGHVGWRVSKWCMASQDKPLPDWERLLAAERHLQHLVPGAVLVGGTAAALHAEHRVSMDGDHVLEDLRQRFDEVLSTLESAAGWQTDRIQRPVLILGQLDGILTGIRQLRRTRPLETEEVSGLRVPTVAEMARIKAWLLVTRHTLRDYLDTVVLLERLGEPRIAAAFRPLDEIYEQAGAASPLAELVERLAAASPSDSAEIDLKTYRGLRPPWNDWDHVMQRGRHWAQVLARVALEEEP